SQNCRKSEELDHLECNRSSHCGILKFGQELQQAMLGLRLRMSRTKLRYSGRELRHRCRRHANSLSCFVRLRPKISTARPRSRHRFAKEKKKRGTGLLHVCCEGRCFQMSLGKPNRRTLATESASSLPPSFSSPQIFRYQMWCWRRQRAER